MAKKQKTTAKEHASQRQTAKRNRRLGTWVGIVAFIAILGYATWAQVGNIENALPAESVADPWLGAAPASTEEVRVVEIVEYADFGCPSCRSWHNAGIREQVLAEFGDQVRFVWKDFPVITANSPQAAEAGHCAATQNKFWAYHDTVYESQTGLGRTELEGYAEATGLDVDAFNQCLDNRTMVLKVQANEQEGRQAGVRGTPEFMVNGRRLGGPPSYEVLANIINQELAQADGG